jgi:hypothetical protein
MGQQQLMLIILGVIVVGIGIAVGIAQFGSDSVSSNKDALINDLNNLSINAYQFRMLPTSMGGGSGSYATYRIPQKLQANADGTFLVASATTSRVTFTATSAIGFGTITTIVDSAGTVGVFTYTGQFQ